MQLETKENKLLHRQELTGTIPFQGATPSNNEVLEALAKKTGKDKETISIKHIYTKYGGNEARFKAYAYESKEHKEKTEPKKKENKKEE